MPIKDADPRARELDEQFTAAMSGPAKPRTQPKTPAERDPEAPFGRDEQGQAVAPYGLHKDGRIKRSAGGRPRKNDPAAARTTDRPQLPAGAAPVDGKVIEPTDYTKPLIEAADGLWLLLSGAAKLPLGRLRVGRYGLPADTGDRLGAQAFLVAEHKRRLAVAFNEAAKHNPRARAWADKLATGDATWVLVVGSLTMPFMVQSLAVLSGPKRTAELEMPSAAELAKRNEQDLAEWLEQLGETAALIQEAADAAG